MSFQAPGMALRVTPPTAGALWAQAVDATSREYDITGLTANGVAFNPSVKDEVFVSIHAETNDIYVAFASATGGTVDDTAIVAAGGTPTYAATACYIVSVNTEARFCIDRNLHKVLRLKAASTRTATARIYFSSDNTYATR